MRPRGSFQRNIITTMIYNHQQTIQSFSMYQIVAAVPINQPMRRRQQITIDARQWNKPKSDTFLLLFIMLHGLSYILRTKPKGRKYSGKKSAKKNRAVQKECIHDPPASKFNRNFFNPYTSKSSQRQDEQFISLQ